VSSSSKSSKSKSTKSKAAKKKSKKTAATTSVTAEPPAAAKSEPLVCRLDYPYESCRAFVEFLYSGTIEGLQNTNQGLLQDLRQLAQMSEDLSYLVDYVNNVRDDLTELNPSIGTFLNDRTADRMKERLIDLQAPPPYYDVELRHATTGDVFYGHRAIIAARCDVLASRIAQGRLQIDNDPRIFKMIMEYIYTEHVHCMPTIATVANAAVLLDLLSVASRYGLSRLVNLCELYLSKTVETATAQSIQHCELDLVQVLLVADDARANQLVDFILHWFCTNYEAVSKRRDLIDRLTPRHQHHLETNKWPPQEYFDRIEQYQRDHEAWAARQGASSASGTSDGKCVLQ
jgi:transcription termination factor NusB